MEPHSIKIGAFIGSSLLAVAGTWLDAAQTHLGLAALSLSVLVSVTLLINGIFTMCHNIHQRNKDLKEQRDAIAEEKRKLEDSVCAERQKTGVCPRSHRDL